MPAKNGESGLLWTVCTDVRNGVVSGMLINILAQGRQKIIPIKFGCLIWAW